MNFIFEHIEFLWIIPVVAFGFFIFLLQLFATKKEDRHDLSTEVARFNTGMPPVAFQMTEQNQEVDRLTQLERAISSVTDSLSTQQRAIEQFHRENTGYNSEINELKNKLRELYKEYDIVISENYSLRAKVKKLEGSNDTGKNGIVNTSVEPQQPAPEPSAASPISTKVDMKMYEDTRMMNLTLLDDTTEIDISDLSKKHDTP